MSKPKVLLIDDDKYFLLLTKEYLEEGGYEVFAVDKVDEGVKLFYSEKPDAVVMDIVMPGEFGTEVCKDLKNTQQGQDTPIILISSGVKEMTEDDSLEEYKADGYLLKPFEKDVFLTILSRQLAKRGGPFSTAMATQRDISFDELDTKDGGEELFKLEEVDEPKVNSKRQAKKPQKVERKGKADPNVKISQDEGGLQAHVSFGPSTRKTFLDNSMINIRNGGFFVETMSPAALGTKVNVKISHPNEEMQLKGMVVWVQHKNEQSGTEAGMGIRFRDQKSEILERLKKYVFDL